MVWGNLASGICAQNGEAAKRAEMSISRGVALISRETLRVSGPVPRRRENIMRWAQGESGLGRLSLISSRGVWLASREAQTGLRGWSEPVVLLGSLGFP